MQDLKKGRKFIGLTGIILGLFMFAIIAQVWAGPPLGHGRRHSLRSHQGHHGQGYAGEGICPQRRNTAQAPNEILKKANPVKSTYENLYEGESLFQVDVQPVACKICHGVSGNGFGIMAQGLNPPPRNFTCKETMKDIADGQLFWIIRNGSPGTGMPAFKDLSDKEIWKIVNYLRKLSKPKLR